MLRPGLIALLCALAVGAVGLLLPAAGGAAAVAPHGAPAATIDQLPRPDAPRVLLLFLPAREKPAKVPPTVKNPPNPQEVVQKRIDQRKQLSIGLVGATQGPYSQEQFLLDLTSGTRTSTATYDTNHPWPMRLSVAGTAGFIDGWIPNKRRALKAPASDQAGAARQLDPAAAPTSGSIARAVRPGGGR